LAKKLSLRYIEPNDKYGNFFYDKGGKFMMLAEAKTMTQGERLQAMEELWNVMCHDDSALVTASINRCISSFMTF